MGKMEQRHAFAAAAAAAAPVAAKLPDMPYGYGELEPVIAGGKEHYIPSPRCTRDAGEIAQLSCLCVFVRVSEIMELHHKKHHQAYVTNYNIALEKLADATVRLSHTDTPHFVFNKIQYQGLEV
jgi:Fe-Mn family superoxide dismutase